MTKLAVLPRSTLRSRSPCSPPRFTIPARHLLASGEIDAQSCLAPHAQTRLSRFGRLDGPRHASLHVVVYHHIAYATDAFTDRLQVTTSPGTFQAHLRFFQRHYDLISPSQLETGKLPKRPLLITFDDAYRSVAEIAGPILRDAGAEALFFINPSAVLDQRIPTDNLVCLAVSRLGLREVARLAGCEEAKLPSLPNLLTTIIARLPAASLARTRQALLDRLGCGDAELHAQAGLFMNRSHLASLRTHGLHVANHTMTHRALQFLSAIELDYEIRVAKEQLEAATGQPVCWLSLPYGSEIDATEAALSAAAASGHTGTFLVQGRMNRFRPAADIFYRVSPRNLPAALLPVSLRLLPMLRTLRYMASP